MSWKSHKDLCVILFCLCEQIQLLQINKTKCIHIDFQIQIVIKQSANCLLDQAGGVVWIKKEVIRVQMWHFTISDVENMNGGKLDRTMKCNLCRNIDKLSRIKRVDLS